MPQAIENTPAPQRGLSDAQAVEQMLTGLSDEERAPQGQAPTSSPEPQEGGDETPQAVGSDAQQPDVDPEEQALEALLQDLDAEEETDEQEAVGDDPEEGTEEELADSEHSEESDEVVEARAILPTDVIFHDPEGNPVTAEEAHRGYLRQSDYTRKTQELSDAKAEFATQVQHRQEEREVLAETLSMALNVIEPRYRELEGLDWDRLSREDPAKFGRMRQQYDVVRENLQKLQGAARDTVEAAKAEQLEARREHLAKHFQIAQRLMPELADPKQAPQFTARLRTYMMRGLGFSEDESKQIGDARNMLAYHKAFQWDLLQAKSKKLRGKKVRRAPKPGMKPGSPKTAAQRQEQARADGMAKLRKSGKIEDGVDMLLIPKG